VPTAGSASAPRGGPAPAPAQPPDLADFRPLATVLTGRVLPSPLAGETLLDTAIGTLAVPIPDQAPPPGAAAQLRITAVAPPESQERPATAGPPDEAPATLQPPLEALTRMFATAAPALAQQVETQLSLPPGDQLAALIFGFLAGSRLGPRERWPDPQVRKALIEVGRGDLAAKLDAEAGPIGQTQPAPAPGHWSISVLPYLGLATTKPMRLYRRTPDDQERQRGGGERFVIELELRRLGAVQLDGLVRERRFDLVLRSDRPLDEGLKALAEQTFRDALLISGWSGELSYARTTVVPLVPLQREGSGIGLSA
jgi:hypothetical protein